ncbi:MAG: glycosyltransferase [Armatimonadota bacterium]|nr:glycosyltransferase [Armatimonadota bacterium]
MLHRLSRVKLLRVITRLNVGGPARHVVTLHTGLDQRRFHSLLVVGRESTGEGSLVEWAYSQGVQPIFVPEMMATLTLGPHDFKALTRILAIILQERPHIVHTHTAKAGFLGRIAARLAGVPVVVHTFHGHILRGYYGPARSWLLRRMERLLAGMSDRLIAVSEQVKRDLVAYNVAPPSKIDVVPLGLDLEPFLDASQYRGAFRRELGLDDTYPLVGIVGRLFPVKNHQLYLDAAAEVAERYPSARFVIVGDGPLRPSLERQAYELGLNGRVIFTGWRFDLPKVYGDLDVLVVSSLDEGTPVAVIEAMAAGCPVVATRVGGLPELIRGGQTGFLVPAGDPSELASTILAVLQDPAAARAIGRRAQSVARERFASARLIAEMERLYDMLLESIR